MRFSYHSNFLEEGNNIFNVGNINVNTNGDLHFLPFQEKYIKLGINGNKRKEYEQQIPISELEEFSGVTKELFDKINYSNNGDTKNINNELSNIPFRLAFSNIPLIYNNEIFSQNPFNNNNQISIDFIKDNLNKFKIPLTVNTNLDGFNGYFTPPDAKLVGDIFTDNLLQFNSEISKIITKKTKKYKIEELKQYKISVGKKYIDNFNYSIDSQTATIEAWKTEVIFDELSVSRFNKESDYYKRDRIYTSFNLESLLKFYTETFSNKVGLLNNDEKIYLDSVQILDNDIKTKKEFNKYIGKLKKNLIQSGSNQNEAEKKLNKSIYQFDTQKQKFYINTKDFKLTPPLILFLRDLYKNFYPNNLNSNISTFIKNINIRRNELGRDFEKIMFKLLGVKGEVQASLKTNFTTPDYIDNNGNIFDFKLTANSSNIKSIEKYKHIGSGNVKIIYFNKLYENFGGNTIYYKDFLEEKGIKKEVHEKEFQLLTKELELLKSKIDLASKNIQKNTNSNVFNSLYFTI